MPLAIKPKVVLHEVLHVNFKTFGEHFKLPLVEKNSFVYSYLRKP